MSSKTQTPDTSFWDQRRGKIRSRKGGWKVGQGVYTHGYEIMTDLVGKTSYFQVMMLNILGYLPERRLADWLEGFYICMSWPDPRIWCNQIGALGASVQTRVAGAAVAGSLASDSLLYGGRTLLQSTTFIRTSLQKYQAGFDIGQIVAEQVDMMRGKPQIVGYARPLVSGDERVHALEQLAAALGFKTGPHLQLAYAIEDFVYEKYGEKMNLAGYTAAFLSDQGLSAEDIYRLCALCVMSGVTACYVEEIDKPPESFLPLRCDDIEYQGKPAREVPPRREG